MANPAVVSPEDTVPPARAPRMWLGYLLVFGWAPALGVYCFTAQHVVAFLGVGLAELLGGTENQFRGSIYAVVSLPAIAFWAALATFRGRFFRLAPKVWLALLLSSVALSFTSAVMLPGAVRRRNGMIETAYASTRSWADSYTWPEALMDGRTGAAITVVALCALAIVAQWTGPRRALAAVEGAGLSDHPVQARSETQPLPKRRGTSAVGMRLRGRSANPWLMALVPILWVTFVALSYAGFGAH